MRNISTDMGFSTVIVVKEPNSKDYSPFFEAVFRQLPSSHPGVDVLVALPPTQTKELNFVLSTLYTQVRAIASRGGFSFRFGINVLISASKSDWDLAFVPKLEDSGDDFSDRTVTIESEIKVLETPDFSSFLHQQFAVAAVGGTFDHLHDGHKILLLMAAFVTKKHLIVGVTGPQMLLKKKYADAMESIQKRIKAVTAFLQQILPSLVTFAIYQIDDVCGPTGFVKDIDALVISEETRKGADFVNDYREKQGFSALEVVSVDVLGATGKEDLNWEGKVSSTDLREQELSRAKKQRLR